MNEEIYIDIEDYEITDDLPLSEHFGWNYFQTEGKVTEDFEYEQLDWMGA